MKNFNLNLSRWRMSLAETTKTIREALTKNFNAEFLWALFYILIAATAISIVILSFMHSSRAGWWSLAIGVIISIDVSIILVICSSRKSFLLALTKLVFGEACIVAIAYLIGCSFTALLPGKSQANSLELEGSILLGIAILAIFSLIVAGIFSDYTENLSKGVSTAEYLIGHFKRFIYIFCGIGTIYLLIHFIGPLIK